MGDTINRFRAERLKEVLRDIFTQVVQLLAQKVELCKYAEKVAAEEMDDTDPSGFDKIDAEKVEQTINKINEALKAGQP